MSSADKTEQAPEFATVETFVQHLLDDERDSFAPWEAQRVAENMKRNLQEVMRELKEFGLTMVIKPKVAEGRGFTSNSHDRWTAKNGFVGGHGIGNASRQMVQSFQPT